MGIRQILRAAGVIAALIASSPVAAQTASAADAKPAQTAAPAAQTAPPAAAGAHAKPAATPAVDLRPLGTPLPDGLEEVDLRRVLAHRALAEADTNCARAADATSAILSYDDPDAVAAPLERALARELICHHQGNEPDRARLAAALLRNLRKNDERPAAVPADVWDRYPAVDATTNVFPAPVTIVPDATGRVWIDLVPRDDATLLTPGPHLVVVAIPGRKRAVTIIKVKERVAQSFDLEPREASNLDVTLDEWRAAGVFPSDMAVGAMNQGPLVILVGDRARVYDGGKRVAEGNHAELAALVAPPVAPIDAVAPPPPERKESPKRGRSWWIYGAAIGAVVLGGVFVYAIDSGEDVQRIEVRWP